MPAFQLVDWALAVTTGNNESGEAKRNHGQLLHLLFAPVLQCAVRVKRLELADSQG